MKTEFGKWLMEAADTVIIWVTSTLVIPLYIYTCAYRMNRVGGKLFHFPPTRLTQTNNLINKYEKIIQMKKQLFLMQRYDENQPIPRNHTSSFPICCDSPNYLRQSRGMTLFRVVKSMVTVRLSPYGGKGDICISHKDYPESWRKLSEQPKDDHLTGIGIFKVGFSSIGVSKKEDSTASTITTRRILFQPETERVVVGQEKNTSDCYNSASLVEITFLLKKSVVLEKSCIFAIKWLKAYELPTYIRIRRGH